MPETKFWTENPCVLFTNCSLFPTAEMSKEEKLNALTRLSLIISFIMYYMGYCYWFTFLILSLLIITILQYYNPNSDNSDDKEGFSITPTYVGTDFGQTVVTPTYAEEWHLPPSGYDLFTNVPYQNNGFEEPMKRQNYPYGQYLTRTNLLPSDEYYIHNLCGSPRAAREYANSSYLRNDISFRENMMRIYKKKLNRRFRHSSNNDTFSPYHSY